MTPLNMVTLSGQSVGYFTAAFSFCTTLVVMSLVVFRIHQATNKLLLSATLSKSATNHWLILSKASQRLHHNNSAAPPAALPPPAPQREAVPGNRTTDRCDQSRLIEQIINKKFMQLGQESKTRRSTSAAHLEGVPDLTDKCREEELFLHEIVDKVFSVSQLKCRRKKKLVRLWHKPTPEPLHAVDRSSIAPRLENIIATFDRRHQFHDNKEYADLLWKKLESSLPPSSSSLLFHVTVFDMEDSATDYGVKTEHPLVLEVLTKHLDGRARTVLVVAVSSGQQPDMDQLDCLQQAALAPVQEVGTSCLTGLCTPRPAQKAEKVYSGCRTGSAGGAGALVICWGCSVWHRWSKHFPVLHVQGQEIWNNVVWTAR